MLIKRIITAALAVTLTVGVAVTSAMAGNEYHHYEETYNYSGTLNELSYTARGTTTTASSSSANFTYYSRYMETSVTARRENTASPIDYDEKTITTSYGGIGASVERNYDDILSYYIHQGILKPSVGNSYTIDSYYITVYQDNYD